MASALPPLAAKYCDFVHMVRGKVRARRPPQGVHGGDQAQVGKDAMVVRLGSSKEADLGEMNQEILNHWCPEAFHYLLRKFSSVRT